MIIKKCTSNKCLQLLGYTSIFQDFLILGYTSIFQDFLILGYTPIFQDFFETRI